jgi:hypothetical protein
MALNTIGRETSKKMIGVLRILEIDVMTSEAYSRCSSILLVGVLSVACLTLCLGMSAKQWKPRLLMALHHVGYAPCECRMAANTLEAKVPFMNIRMACLTCFLGSGKNELFVTTIALDRSVHTGQFKPG